MKFHEIANLLPLMQADELSDLAADIKSHGLREPIYTYAGEIVDGRNRFLACEKAGVQPKFVEWDGQGSLIAFVVSENVKRRHLTSTQRAVIGEAAEELFAEEAKKRREATLKQNASTVKEIIPERDKGQSRDQAAKVAGTNGRYISEIKLIKQTAPELVPLMRDGKATVQEAKVLKALPAEDRKIIVKEVTAGATLNQAIDRLSLIAPLPTPAQARKIAIATGRPVLANNNYEIPPVTEQEEKRVVDELMLITDFAEAVEVIAQFAMPHAEVWVQLKQYYVQDFDRNLIQAIHCLTQLQTSRRSC